MADAHGAQDANPTPSIPSPTVLTPTPLPLPPSEAKVKQALSSAWRRFNEYDRQANRLKIQYNRFRYAIIVLTLLTTIFAVFDPFVGKFLPPNTELPQSITDILRLLLIVLPLLGAVLLAFSARFETGNAWVGLRVAAENIKRGIYTVRVKQRYGFLNDADLIALANMVADAGKLLDTMSISTPIFWHKTDTLPMSESPTKPNYIDNEAVDDGYRPLSLDDYLQARLYPQIKWYRLRATKDYTATRRFRFAILVAGVLAPILVFLDVSILVAVAVALVTALTAWLSLTQFEQNYGLFNSTARQLEDSANHFSLIYDTSKPEQVVQWIEEVENIFRGEREVWKLTVLKGQAATEEALNQLVNSHTNILHDLGKLATPREFTEVVATADRLATPANGQTPPAPGNGVPPAEEIVDNVPPDPTIPPGPVQ